MTIPVWTSTKNSLDVEDENAYLESQNVLSRISSSKLDALSTDRLDFKSEKFKAQMQFNVPTTFLFKILTDALKVCESSLDLELRHILLSLEGETLKVYAGSKEKLHIYKLDISTDEEVFEGSPVDFRIGMVCEDIRAILHFLNKCFLSTTSSTPKNSGRCSIGVKLNTNGECENILLACYSYEAESLTILEQTMKTALFKIPRSIGESPLPLLSVPIPESNYYKTKLKPAIRWAFPKGCDYVEFVNTKGLLEIRYATEEVSARASLGGYIETDMSLPSNTAALGASSGSNLFTVLDYIKTELTIYIGYTENEEKVLCAGPTIIDSEELTAYISQSRPITLSSDEVYITKRKNEIVETTVEEATADALKKNKIKKKEAAVIVDAISDEGVQDVAEVMIQRAKEAALLPAAKKAVEIKKGNSEELVKISKEVVIPPSDKIAEPSLSIDERLTSLETTVGELKELLKRILSDDSDPVIALKSSPIPRHKNTFSYATDDVASYIIQCKGDAVSSAILRNVFPAVKPTTIYHILHRFDESGVIKRVKRGRYLVPDDVAERYVAYKGARPNNPIFNPKDEELEDTDAEDVEDTEDTECTEDTATSDGSVVSFGTEASLVVDTEDGDEEATETPEERENRVLKLLESNTVYEDEDEAKQEEPSDYEKLSPKGSSVIDF